MLIQFHLLQNYAPANLNRDDTGSPKDAYFGGYLRGRISSQCLKRSMRRSQTFAEAFGARALLAARTKALPSLIAQELEALGASREEIQAIVARVPEFGQKEKGKEESDEDAASAGGADEAAASDGQTRQLIFLAANERRPLAETLLTICRNEGGPKKFAKVKMDDIKKRLGSSVPRSVDIALFGRMTTDAAFADVQAAAQVAHALSTNVLTQEFDYYTAVDDLSGESGAGMIGDVEYNSNTYYKYLNVHWEQLVHNLGGDVATAQAAVLALLEAACFAQPTGKQNSFAAHNLPDFVLVERSQRNLPVNYANAFLKPARASGGETLVGSSVKLLTGHVQTLARTWGLQAERATLATDGAWRLEGAHAATSLEELKGWLAQGLPTATSNGGAVTAGAA